MFDLQDTGEVVMNVNAVVLRDIPKQEVRLDLFRCPIEGGFRGFRSDMALVGWHYVAVKAEAHHAGFWCYLRPGEAAVRVFEGDRGFVADEPESEQHYARLALSGAMDHVLMPYPADRYDPWFALVSHIGPDNFPPRLHGEDGGAGSRFEKAWHGTHDGRIDSFLAEFQYAFVRWLVSLDTAVVDEAALARWRHLVLSGYNAGEASIAAAGDLFCHLADTLMRQMDVLPADWFVPGSFLTSQAGYMAEDMIDTGLPALVERGRAFARYLEKVK
jgi:hypothetical protein